MKQGDLWEIGNISKSGNNPYVQVQNPTQGKLEIYYARKNRINNDGYELAARFKPHDKEQAIIKFKDFDEKYEEVKSLEKSLGFARGEFRVFPFLYILKASQTVISNQAVKVTSIEELQEPEELLHLDKIFVKRWGDYITLEEDNEEPISLYKAETIRNIYQALLKGQPFSIKLQPEEGECFIRKVKDFEIDTVFGWDGWALHFMPVSLGMSFFKVEKLEVITVNLKDEQESYYYYQINKWIARGLMTAVMLLIGYKLKNNISMFFKTN